MLPPKERQDHTGGGPMARRSAEVSGVAADGDPVAGHAGTFIQSEAHRQSLAVARSKLARDVQAFADAVSDLQV